LRVGSLDAVDAWERIILSSSSKSITVVETEAPETPLDLPIAPGDVLPIPLLLPPIKPVPRSGTAIEVEILKVPMLGI
jgi:hypothetical protein